jgi:hypothetical protein
MGMPPLSQFSERTNWLRHLAARSILRKLSSAFDAATIPFVLVKGIVTAHTLYDDPACRPVRDIDLRIRRRDFGPAVRLGRAKGWHAKHVVLVGQVLWRIDGMEVDLKSAMGPPGICAVSIDDVIRRAQLHVNPFDFPHLEPELNDHALILVLNVFKDGLRAVPWAIEDLRRIVRHERFLSAALVDRAATGRVTTALWIVADWLAKTQNAAEWRAIRDRIGPRPPNQRVASTYSLWRSMGSPRRIGHFLVPSENDDPRQAVRGLANATAGLVRGYGLRAVERVWGKP